MALSPALVSLGSVYGHSDRDGAFDFALAQLAAAELALRLGTGTAAQVADAQAAVNAAKAAL